MTNLGLGRTILLAEDDVTLAKLIHLGLSAKGYNVEIVADGLKALEVVKQSQPDLMILDLYMPGMDGLEVLDSVRREQKLTFPILVFSASDIDEKVLIDHGANGFLAKPVNLNHLITKVTECLSSVGVP